MTNVLHPSNPLCLSPSQNGAAGGANGAAKTGGMDGEFSGN